MKYLGIDYGKQRVGVAVGDSDTRIALGKDTLEGYTLQQVINYLQQTVQAEDIDEIVMGLPLNMQGQPTQFTNEVKNFVETLCRDVKIVVHTIDERLTSQMADRALQSITIGRRKQDQVAAQMILQTYLDKLPR